MFWMQSVVIDSIFVLVTPGGFRACKDCSSVSNSSIADMATLRCPAQSGTDDTCSVQLYGGPLAEWLKVGGKHVGLRWREYYQVNIGSGKV